MKSENWRLAMDSEIKFIEKNKTWTVIELPLGAKKKLGWSGFTKPSTMSMDKLISIRLVWFLRAILRSME